MKSTEFHFPGSVGLLAVVFFVITELLFLSLFGQTRERLTVTYLPHRFANGDSAWLGRESELNQWIGISDGVYIAERSSVLSPFLKMLLKLVFLVSSFVFDFKIEHAKFATKATYHFNGGGAYAIAQIPVDGMHLFKAKSLEKGTEIIDNIILQGLGIDISSWFISTEHSLSSVQ